jgi:hypothetical protein
VCQSLELQGKHGTCSGRESSVCTADSYMQVRVHQVCPWHRLHTGMQHGSGIARITNGHQSWDLTISLLVHILAVPRVRGELIGERVVRAIRAAQGRVNALEGLEGYSDRPGTCLCSDGTKLAADRRRGRVPFSTLNRFLPG